MKPSECGFNKYKNENNKGFFCPNAMPSISFEENVDCPDTCPIVKQGVRQDKLWERMQNLGSLIEKNHDNLKLREVENDDLDRAVLKQGKEIEELKKDVAALKEGLLRALDIMAGK